MKSLGAYFKSETFDIMALFFTIVTLLSFSVVSLYALWAGPIDIILPLKITLIAFLIILYVKLIFSLITSVRSRDLMEILLSVVFFILPPFILFSLSSFVLQFVYENVIIINLENVLIENKLILTAGLILIFGSLLKNILYFQSLIKEKLFVVEEWKTDWALFVDKVKTRLNYKQKEP